MRQLLCRACGWDQAPGRRMLLGRGALDEPAEYERVVRGLALRPAAEQRIVRVNDEAFQLGVEAYDCDRCSVHIAPGDSAVAWTVWRSDQLEPGAWEHEYLTVEGAVST